MYQIAITHQSRFSELPPTRLRAAIESVLSHAGIRQATISVAVVDDLEIHELNVRYLDHDWPTDVLSFLLERTGDALDGEIVVSVETAESSCAEHGTTPEDELLLYVIHGALHLVGYDDHDDASRAEMRRREREVLAAVNSAK